MTDPAAIAAKLRLFVDSWSIAATVTDCRADIIGLIYEIVEFSSTCAAVEGVLRASRFVWDAGRDEDPTDAEYADLAERIVTAAGWGQP